jgi:hypothetical protein
MCAAGQRVDLGARVFMLFAEMKTCFFYQAQIPACVLENINPVVVISSAANNAG